MGPMTPAEPYAYSPDLGCVLWREIGSAPGYLPEEH